MVDIAPPDGCSQRKLEGGTFDETSIAALAGVTEVSEHLTVTGDLTDLSALDCLVAVRGDLVVRSTQLRSLAALRHLRYVAGSIQLEDNMQLEELDALATLHVVRDGVVFRNSPLATRVALPQLQGLGSLVLEDCEP